jgi:hypothetical protein
MHANDPVITPEEGEDTPVSTTPETEDQILVEDN